MVNIFHVSWLPRTIGLPFQFLEKSLASKYHLPKSEVWELSFLASLGIVTKALPVLLTTNCLLLTINCEINNF